MVRDIVKDIDRLEIPCKPIDNSMIAKSVVKDLIDTAELWQKRPVGCLGLAANQINHMHRIIVIWHCGNFVPMINPVIENIGTQSVGKREGCLSFPGKNPKIKRAKKIYVTYNTPEMNTVRAMFTGMTARIIQHEVDHLNGRHI